jgi:hypothetical protein
MMKSTISPPKVSKSTSTFTLFGLHSTTKFRAKSTIYIYPSPPLINVNNSAFLYL